MIVYEKMKKMFSDMAYGEKIRYKNERPPVSRGLGGKDIIILPNIKGKILAISCGFYLHKNHLSKK